MFLALLIVARISICCAILVYGSLICEVSILIRQFKHPYDVIASGNTWRLIRIIGCAAFVIWYDHELSIPSTATIAECITLLGIQLLFIAVGLSLMNQSFAARNYISARVEKYIGGHAHKKESRYDNVVVLRHHH